MTRLTAQAYTVAWLCALPLNELVVATAMLDEEHDPLNPPTHDDNSYTYGSINGHSVVIACMPPGQPGKVSAAKLVQPLSQSFSNLKIHLFVGIGSGVPRIPPPDKPEDDIHLGDVVIGWAEQTGVPGVVQWDLVRYLEDRDIEPPGILDKPDRRLLNALGLVLANRVRGRTRFSEHLKRLQDLSGFWHPGLEHDNLFKLTYHHEAGPSCSSCDRAQFAERPPRVNQDLVFHQGTIVSGDTVMTNPQQRDKISKICHGALCFEMEAAGVMDDKHCLIIRGIADYADSHKDSSWQNYAAGTAAAFAREFLFTIQPQVVNKMESAASLNSIPMESAMDQNACLQSLFFPEIDFRKNDVVDPIDKTCIWLLEHSIYLRWLGEHRGLLWLKGKPGAGKSTLLRFASRQQKIQDGLILASFFFHGRGALIQNSLLGCLRSLLFQILQQSPDSLSSCSRLFKKKCDTQGKVEEKWEWQASELQELFKTYISNIIRTYPVQIFVDALDECGEQIAIDLVDFFQRLMDELPHTKASFRVFFSCRHYPLVALGNGLEICTEDENRGDIEIYVRKRLKNGIQDKTTLEKLQADILQRSLNVFQWVVLVVPHVILLHRQGKSLRSIQKALQNIPSKLSELYQELLQGIDDDEKPQSLQLMQWIFFAWRPLSLRELRFAMAVDAHTPHDSLSKCQAAEEYADTDEEMEKRVNHLSKGLAEVKYHDGEKFPQFIHQSVSDYLLQAGLNILTKKPVTDDVVGSAHFRLSRSCIRYMSMKEVDGSSWITHKVWVQLYPKFPFLEYAVRFWLKHAKVVNENHISQTDLLDLFNQLSRDNFQAWIEMHNRLVLGPSSEGPTLLHTALSYGFDDIVSAILEKGDYDPNAQDGFGITPLLRAVSKGDIATVKSLLANKDVLPNLGDLINRTPLHKAAGFSSDSSASIVKLLLARKDVKPNSKDWNYVTPLSEAAANGCTESVKLLLARRDVNPNMTDHKDRTPLYFAVSNGDVEMVKLLLAHRDINPNLADYRGMTPLHGAAIRGSIAIVRLLLARRDVNPNLTDSEIRTPLYIAAGCGDNEMVELLLVNLADCRGTTPLHGAAIRESIAIVRLLLARRDVNPNLTNREDRTPLYIAACCGKIEMVKLLLARKDIEVQCKNPSYPDPMQAAKVGGHEEIVKLLESTRLRPQQQR